MSQSLLPKSKLPEFVEHLISAHQVVGPVQLAKGHFKYDRISSHSELSLKHLPTILPPKKYYLPLEETLLTYDISAGQRMNSSVEVENLVIFGLHTCDLAGIQCLNMVFSDQPRDMHYLVRKARFTLIGFECNEYCDGYASCALLRNHLPKGGYDLFFTELKEHYYIDINTDLGGKLVNQCDVFQPVDEEAEAELRHLRKTKKQVFKSEVPIRYQDIPRLLNETYSSDIWKKVGQRCLSCGNCTTVCPTCYCFDIIDEPELNLVKGRRIRRWDSCQHEGFAKVAGGENFRHERFQRQRHRFNRKFRNPMDRYKRAFCVGCGRCSRSCMAKIDLKETLNALIEERA